MVNRKMRPAQALSVVRRAARAKGLQVVELPGGKGSHQPYALVDSDGKTVGTFGLTMHPREMSWTVMRSIEDGLAHLLGERWMEK